VLDEEETSVERAHPLHGLPPVAGPRLPALPLLATRYA